MAPATPEVAKRIAVEGGVDNLLSSGAIGIDGYADGRGLSKRGHYFSIGENCPNPLDTGSSIDEIVNWIDSGYAAATAPACRAKQTATQSNRYQEPPVEQRQKPQIVH